MRKREGSSGANDKRKTDKNKNSIRKWKKIHRKTKNKNNYKTEREINKQIKKKTIKKGSK